LASKMNRKKTPKFNFWGLYGKHLLIRQTDSLAVS
jgi:hypothetical protein